MRISHFKSKWAIWTLMAIAHALPQTFAPGLSGVEAGRYRIINCGPKTEQLVTLLHILRQTLGPVSDDAASSPTSNAYNTFFKHVAYAPYVRQILQFIADGIAISSNNDGDANSPIIICSTATKQITYEQENGEIMDAHTKCTTQASVLSFSLINSPYKPTVVLCPGFFYEAPVPSMSKENCLTVEPHFNLFRQNGAVLVRYQLWALMHELAHLYIFAHNGGMVDIYTVNGCLALIAHQAAQNAQSFIYYAANVRLGCTEFPVDKGLARLGIIELLEIEGKANGTLQALSAALNVSTPERNLSGNLTVVFDDTGG